MYIHCIFWYIFFKTYFLILKKFTEIFIKIKIKSNWNNLKQTKNFKKREKKERKEIQQTYFIAVLSKREIYNRMLLILTIKRQILIMNLFAVSNGAYDTANLQVI